MPLRCRRCGGQASPYLRQPLHLAILNGSKVDHQTLLDQAARLRLPWQLRFYPCPFDGKIPPFSTPVDLALVLEPDPPLPRVNCFTPSQPGFASNQASSSSFVIGHSSFFRFPLLVQTPIPDYRALFALILCDTRGWLPGPGNAECGVRSAEWPIANRKSKIANPKKSQILNLQSQIPCSICQTLRAQRPLPADKRQLWADTIGPLLWVEQGDLRLTPREKELLVLLQDRLLNLPVLRSPDQLGTEGGHSAFRIPC